MSSSRKLNSYICSECKCPTITVDRDAGATPFMITCRAGGGCRGSAYSSFYSTPAGSEPSHEFYKPSENELAAYAAKGQPGVVEHCRMGGLLLRPIDPSFAVAGIDPAD